MKKLLFACVLILGVMHITIAQSNTTAEESATFKKLALEKAAVLKTELSLSEVQEEKIAMKIYKFSLIAKEVLQSDISNTEKSKQLYSVAANQRGEIKNILSEDQYNFFKRRESQTASASYR